MAKSAAPRTDRPTIGVLIDALDGVYEISILAGLLEAARDHDVNLVCFGGGVVKSPNPSEPLRNVLYDLTDGKTAVDGWVFVSGTLTGYIAMEELQSLCDRYRPRPRASLTVALAGVPSVLVDNTSGLREALNHLIEEHGYRRIAFICGPEGNSEAEARYQTYLDALTAHHLPFDPALVAHGDFLIPSGGEAIRLLLDERRVTFRALVAANDNMAIGALDALQARGIKMPEQVALVGFDDSERARLVNPPLTTVRQPIYIQGRQALEMVLAQLRGEKVPELVFLPAELVIRQSCGCSYQAALPALTNASNTSAPFASLAAQRESILVRMKQAARLSLHGIAPEKIERLLDALFAELQGEKAGIFISALEEALQSVELGIDVAVWQELLAVLRRQVLPYASDDAAMWQRADRLWQDTRILIGQTAQRIQGNERTHAELRTRRMSSVTQGFNNATDIAGLATTLAEGMPNLQNQHCYLALYEHPEDPTSWARLVLAYVYGRQLELKRGGRRFPTRRILPAELLPGEGRYTLAVLPLFFGEEQQGFVVLDLANFEEIPNEGFMYEALREQISGALKGIWLYQRVVERERKLRQRVAELGKANLELGQANTELSLAYKALQENQEKLLVAEKMASLGRLTAGIVYEMNAPLAAVRQALDVFEQQVREYSALVEAARMDKNAHRVIVARMRASIDSAAQAGKWAAGFVRGIKAHTRDPGAQAAEQHFDAVALIRETLLLLRYTLREKRCEAHFETSASVVELHGPPDRLAEVIANLVLNAADASLPKGGGTITLRLSRDAAAVTLAVIDQGSGIAPENLSKIFEAMFTTKPPGEGTGLGLVVVHDIVTSEFAGSLKVDSLLGQGSTFTLRFPVHGHAV